MYNLRGRYIVNNPLNQIVRLSNEVKACYFRFVAKRTVDGSAATIAELGWKASEF